MKKAMLTVAIFIMAGFISDALAQHHRVPPPPHRVIKEKHKEMRYRHDRMHRDLRSPAPHRYNRAHKQKINAQAANVRLAKKMALADGHISRSERRIIAAENKKLNRTIHKARRY